MHQELWNEICYHLNDTTPSNPSEQLYESKVVQVFEKLGWNQYKGEISVRETIPFGANNRMHPDIVVRTQKGENLFVVEVKRPSENLDNSSFEHQLSSYMRMLKMRIGILIGNKIKIFVDNGNSYQDDLVLIDEFALKKHSKKGDMFVRGFRKHENAVLEIDTYVQNRLKDINAKKAQKQLLNHINTTEFKNEAKGLIKDHLQDTFSGEVIDSVLAELKIVFQKTEFLSQDVSEEDPIKTSVASKNSSEINKNVSNKKTKDGLKIGAYVQQTFKRLFENDVLSNSEIAKLKSPDHSKRIFNQQYPVLRDITEGTADEKGYNRYYTRHHYGGKYYLISQWYEFHWPYFEEWLRSVRAKN